MAFYIATKCKFWHYDLVGKRNDALNNYILIANVFMTYIEGLPFIVIQRMNYVFGLRLIVREILLLINESKYK